MKLTNPIEQIDQQSLNKYKDAGLIASRVLDKIVKNTIQGENIKELCEMSDKLIIEECDKIYKNIKYKGISYPTCISLNNIAGNYNQSGTIKEGDIVKIELGVHIDGFPAFIGYTVYVENILRESDKTFNKKKNVVKAVIEASREIYELFKPHKTNFDVIRVLEKYAEKYNCSLPICNDMGIIPGVMSYQISRYVSDGFNEDNDEFVHSLILSRENQNYGFNLRETEFEENEVYAVDILMSSGTGKLNIKDLNETNIYKRNHHVREQLKLQSSRNVLNLFNNESFPKKINLNDSRTKLGLKECIDKGLIESYPVVYEKEDEFIARIKFTVIVNSKPILIAGRPAEEQLIKMK